jgi:DNA repair exonuclease SbcCD ATPase subunit
LPPDTERKRLAKVAKLILRAEAQHARDVWTDAILEKWHAWDELRRLRKRKTKDEAQIQALLKQIEEWAEQARTLRPPEKKTKGRRKR